MDDHLFYFFLQGNVYCFSKLDEATLNADLVIEAIEENLEAKQGLFDSKKLATLLFILCIGK